MLAVLKVKWSVFYYKDKNDKVFTYPNTMNKYDLVREDSDEIVHVHAKATWHGQLTQKKMFLEKTDVPQPPKY